MIIFAHVLKVSVTKGGHMAPTHCTGVSQFLLEISDIFTLPNLTFVDYYNPNFLLMKIMTCVPPSLSIFWKSQKFVKSKVQTKTMLALRQLLFFNRNVIPFSKLSIIALNHFSHCFYASKIVFDASKHQDIIIKSPIKST